VLTEEQKIRYEQTRQMAKSELDQIDREIEGELSKVKEKLLELQQAKKAVKLIYDGACARLGIKSSVEMKDINLAELNR
jgi:hypothetical protein